MVWPIMESRYRRRGCDSKSMKAVALAASQKGCWRKIAISPTTVPGRSEQVRLVLQCVLDCLLFGSQERRGTNMANLSGIVKQLKKERDQVEKQLSGLNAAISAF